LEACRPSLLTLTLTLSSHILLFSVILRYYTKPGTRHSKPRAYTPELWSLVSHTAQYKEEAPPSGQSKRTSKQATYARSGRLDSHPLGSPTKPSERERERERETRTPEDNKNQYLPSHPISIKCSSHQTYTKRETPELSLEPPIILRQERATNSHVPSTSPLGPASSYASHVSHNTRDNGTVSHQTTRALHSARYR
jgi:hypothetical protein